MSSFEGVQNEVTGSQGSPADLWRVQLGTGELRVMTLDALDDAFQAGTIDEHTPVLAPGSTVWTKLADAAGLDTSDSPPESAGDINDANAPSVAPLAVSIATDSTGDVTPYSQRPPTDFGDLDRLAVDDEAAFKPKKGRIFAVVGIAVLFVGGLGFAATRVGNIGSAMTLSMENKAKAAAQAPPPAAGVDLSAADIRARALTEEQKARLADFDKSQAAALAAKEEQRRKDRPPPPPVRNKGPRDKGAPFSNGGNKFDPLNGAL